MTLSTPFDKDITEYSVYTEYDVSKIDICINYTLGARVRINNVYVSAGEMHSIADIPHGSTTVLIELLDGLETLKTYTVNVHREYEASPEKLLELNELMRNTTDADAEAVKILAAMGDANIGDAIIVLTGKYKEEYDAEYNGEDLTQKQFTALVKKVNAANKDMLASSIGIKNDGGYVYKETVYKDSSGMYSVKLKYAALASSDNKKLAVYINGKKYESEAVNLNPLNGWTETELTIRLESGESKLEVYAESVNDGNYGLLIKSAEISEDKLPVESKILLAKDFAKLKIYKINGNNSYIGNTNSSIGNAVLGGNIIFRFNSNDAQKATIKLKWSPNVKTVNFGTLAFFNPVKVYDVAKNEVCTEDMTEGVDYPSQSDAVINNMLTADDWNTGRGSWKDGQEKTWCETEIEVELSVGENILWFPAKMLGEYDADTETVKNGPYGFGNTLANGQSLIYSIEIIPESFELE